jgi:hypothetical protein
LCWSTVVGRMSDSKVPGTNQTKWVESQVVTSLGENPTLQITTVKLDEFNYLAWSQSALLSTKSRGKMGYLNGRIQEQQPNDPTYDKWEAENSTIMSWLLHSMQPEIGQEYLFLHIAKEVWDVAAQTYSKVGNVALKYDLKRRIHGLTQGDSLVAPYFHKLRSLWQELNHYQNFQPMCAVDAAQIKKMIEKRIYEFLGGLNSEYDLVRVQIFGKEPLPSLQEVFSYIQNEESRRSTMLHSSSQSQSALVGATQRTPSNSSKFRDRDRTADATSEDKDKLFCDHCTR